MIVAGGDATGDIAANELHVSEFQLIAVTAIIFCYAKS